MKLLQVSLAAALFVVAAQVQANVIEIRDFDHFESIVNKGKPVVAKFYAEWCGPCKQFKPTFEKVAKQLKGKVTFVAVDADKNQDVLQEYGVKSLPTVLYFNDGEKVGSGSKRDEAGFKKEVLSKLGL